MIMKGTHHSIFKGYQTYLVFVFASLISGIGSGFIQIVVYNQIAAHNLPPIYFGLAFALSVFPALLGSHIGRLIAEKEKFNIYIAYSQLLAIIVILLIDIVSLKSNIKYILFCEAITSFSASVAFPVLQKLIKLTFKPEKLSLAAKFDTYLYGANIILGLGLGSLLSSLVDLKGLLIISLVLYVISTVFFFFSAPKYLSWEAGQAHADRFSWKALNHQQKLSFILMPTLIIVGTPATSLLPSIYSNFYGNDISNYFMISPVLLLLVFRSIGQFIGPLIIKGEKFDALSQNSKIIYFSLFFFLGTYIFIFSTNNFYCALMLVVLAHIASNVIFSLAIYLTLASFNTEEIAKISSFQYQINQLVITLTAILSGISANYLGGRLTIIIFAFVGLSIFSIIKPKSPKLLNYSTNV